MDRPRAEGKSLGMPQRRRAVTDYPMWSRVLGVLEAGDLTRAEAARKLQVPMTVLIQALAEFPKGGPSTGTDGELGGGALSCVTKGCPLGTCLRLVARSGVPG